MRLKVYGRVLEVARRGDAWCVYDFGNEGKKRPAADVRIPPGIELEQVAQYLGDLLHEYATARHADVRVIDVPAE
ncbi:MAG: hypothetical protein R3228_12850 [Halioglobus sp.]|nr:hypothetical protein [Halioglobus sp.]